VDAAIHTVQPFGVDLCSSVRVNGERVPVLLEAFIKRVD
jgi:phosphoribosylanthranilate isomerase